MIRKTKTFFTWSILFLLHLALSDALEALERLHVRGRNLVDPHGNIVTLRGVQHDQGFYWHEHGEEAHNELLERLGDRADTFFDYGCEAWFSEWDATFLENIPMNSIRLRFSYYELSPAIGVLDLSAVDRYVSFIELCAAHQIYVVPCMTPPGGWGRDSDLWGNEENKAWFSWLWEMIAIFTAQLDGVAGYDLQNEPYPPTEEEYREVCRDARDAIREHTNKPIFYSFPFGGLPKMYFGFDDQEVYTGHYYAPLDFTHEKVEGLTYPGWINGVWWNKSRIRNTIAGWCMDFFLAHRVPVYLGEYGCKDGAAGQVRWVSDVRETVEPYWVCWTYFKYKHYKRTSTFAMLKPREFVHVNDVLDPLIDDPYHQFRPADFDFMRTQYFRLNDDLLNVLN